MQRNIPITPQAVISMVIIFGLVGIIASLPIALIVAILFGGAVAGDVLLLSALLIGSWLPVTILVSPQSNNDFLLRLIPSSFSPLILLVSALGFLLLIPVIWGMIAPAFLVTMLGYILTGQNLLLSLVIAVLAQAGFVYQGMSSGGEMTATFQTLDRVEDVQDAFNVETVTLSGDDVSVNRRDDSSADDTDDEPAVRYLSAGDDSVSIPPPDDSRTIHDDSIDSAGDNASDNTRASNKASDRTNDKAD
jgi:hypothetical protein